MFVCVRITQSLQVKRGRTEQVATGPPGESVAEGEAAAAPASADNSREAISGGAPAPSQPGKSVAERGSAGTPPASNSLGDAVGVADHRM